MLDGPTLIEKMGCCLSYGLGKSSPHELTFCGKIHFPNMVSKTDLFLFLVYPMLSPVLSYPCYNHPGQWAGGVRLSHIGWGDNPSPMS